MPDWADLNLADKIAGYQPETTIHAAWGGVKVEGRDDWGLQMENINFTYKVLDLSKRVGARQFIACGSWFEYGMCSGRISEDHPVRPNSAYSAAKVSASYIVKQFCEQNEMSWVWLRLFSMTGKHEDEQWITSYVINTILSGNPVNLTGCEQKMDYSNIGFICSAIFKIAANNNLTGLFNLGSNQSIRLKDLIEFIVQNLGEYNPVIHFGALPYRPNQVMHIEGDSSALYRVLDLEPTSRIHSAIEEIISYYKAKTL